MKDISSKYIKKMMMKVPVKPPTRTNLYNTRPSQITKAEKPTKETRNYLKKVTGFKHKKDMIT
jgi:hypothetical protein